ncbi:MAG: hypothetical protein RML72_07405 [Bacteroidia bacterium]|nr:hypothetical protein [Bacteroidia bacterium]
MNSKLIIYILSFFLVWSNSKKFEVWGQQCNIIYVAPNGATQGASGEVGTAFMPADINYAINLLTPSTRKIYLAAGTYFLKQTFPLRNNNIEFEGGFDPSNNWAKTTGKITRIIRTRDNVTPNPNRLVAIEARNISGFRIQDVTIQVEDATPLQNSVSTYGVYINNCSNYTINRCIVIAGDAADGTKGADGANGRNGGNGRIGREGDEDGPCCRDGGAGGNAWSNGLVAGGRGGNGGQRGTIAQGFNGDRGQDGFSPLNLQGRGGSPGIGRAPVVSLGCDNDGTSGMDGSDGEPGLPGKGRNVNPLAFDGVRGIATHAMGFFQPGSGTDGKDGEPGGGGGGGGGGGSQGGISASLLNTLGTGAGGGGGGEGGEGGKGGKGGGRGWFIRNLYS